MIEIYLDSGLLLTLTMYYIQPVLEKYKKDYWYNVQNCELSHEMDI